MPGASSISSQSDCARPRPSVRKRCDSSKAVVANTTCPNPTPSVRKPPGTSGDENGVARVGQPERRPRRSTPHGDVVRARRLTRRSRALARRCPRRRRRRSRAAGRRWRRTRRRRRPRSRPRRRRSPAPGCTMSGGRDRRCATCARRPRRLAGDEADDLGEHGREDVGVRHLEDEVAEFDLVVHANPLGSGQRLRRRAGEQSSGVRPERVEQRTARVAGRVEALGGHRGDELGGERVVAAVVQVVEGRERRAARRAGGESGSRRDRSAGGRGRGARRPTGRHPGSGRTRRRGRRSSAASRPRAGR